MIVFACNTATAVAWEEVKEKLDIPVLGVILPGASANHQGHPNWEDWRPWDPMTIQSDIYRQKIQALSPRYWGGKSGLSQICPLVESNNYQSSLAKK